MLFTAAVAGCESTGPAAPSPQGGTVSRNEAVSNALEIQGLRDELALLRNEIELQRMQLDKMVERQRDLYDDLDYRLRQQERMVGAGITMSQPSSGSSGLATSNTGSGFTAPQPAPAAPSAAGGTLGQPPAQGTGTGVVGTVPSAGGQMTATAGQPAMVTQPVAGAAQAAIATQEEQAAYDEAFNLLKQSRYQESVAAFRQQLATHPGGALADDAQYWIGEAMYVTRDFPGGLTAFETVVKRYPDSARVAEAMLKLGYIQYELGAKEQARQTFTEVVNRFPGSRVAISAQTRLRKLQADGG